VHIQYEGYELLKDLALIPAIQDAVLVALVTILKIPGANVDHAAENKPGKNKSKITAQDKSNLEASESFMTVVYIQQTYAAKLVGYLAATNRAIGDRLISIDVIPGLLNSVANICHAECQKNAASSLQV
jgi:hypothetical protein